MNNKVWGVVLMVLGVLVIALVAIKLTTNKEAEQIIDNDTNDAEVVEEEVNPELTDNKWAWIRTIYTDKDEIVPEDSEKFVLTFDPGEKMFNSTTDCNSLFGSYELKKDNKISLSDVGGTLMFCEGSQEAEYSAEFQNISSYEIDEGGLVLKFPDGEMEFAEVE